MSKTVQIIGIPKMRLIFNISQLNNRVTVNSLVRANKPTFLLQCSLFKTVFYAQGS